MEADTDKYFFQRQEIVDENLDYTYETIPVDDDASTEQEEELRRHLEEDLNSAVLTIQDTAQDELAKVKREDVQRVAVTHRPEVVDDFVRNFLIKMGLHQTLDVFQTEWYELEEKGLIEVDQLGFVPDIYTKNQQLQQELQRARAEGDKFKIAAMKAKEVYVKLKKERDYHRMHHKRVVQEKNRLITDLRRLKEHYSTYEPTLQHLRHKYETAMKEKMLTKLDRDRYSGQVQGLRSTLKTIEDSRNSQPAGSLPVSATSVERNGGGRGGGGGGGGVGPTQTSLAIERNRFENKELTDVKHPNDSKFPRDTGINPHLAHVKSTSTHLARVGGLRQSQIIQAHSHAVSSVVLHPRKQLLATTSDDHTWKIWSVPNGQLIVTGRGHTDWIADCDFHPSGTMLATVSGDTTVKLWDVGKEKCTHTFMEHQKPVWGCSFHSCGDFLATCSLDNNSKIWDVNSLRCRCTLRGHKESVNCVEFLSFSNTLITGSADKTVSLWDARMSICAQTFYGHNHSVNHCTFNLRGDTVASCDSFGIVNLWDVRMVARMTGVDTGPHQANQVHFDPSGAVLAIASNDASVKTYDLATGKVQSMVGHEDAVQCAVFDRDGEFLISGSSDLTVRIWS